LGHSEFLKKFGGYSQLCDIAGVNNTGDKLFTGVNDTGEKLNAGVVDTSDKPCLGFSLIP
jgi:hypothetical protein